MPEVALAGLGVPEFLVAEADRLHRLAGVGHQVDGELVLLIGVGDDEAAGGQLLHHVRGVVERLGRAVGEQEAVAGAPGDDVAQSRVAVMIRSTLW